MNSLDADGIILAIPPAPVAKLTGRPLPQLRPVRAACLDLGLRSVGPLDSTLALGIDRPLYLSMHSASAKLAPEGGAVVHLAKYLGAAEPDPARDLAELEGLAHLALPGWRSRAEAIRFLPNMPVAHAMPAPEGRPDADALGLDHVQIAGDWVGPEGMLADAAVASGLRAAAMVQRRKAKAA